jgi:hypothetical protein
MEWARSEYGDRNGKTRNGKWNGNDEKVGEMGNGTGELTRRARKSCLKRSKITKKCKQERGLVRSSTQCLQSEYTVRFLAGRRARKTRGFLVVSLPDTEPALTRLARRQAKRKGVARVKGDSMVGRAEPIRYSDCCTW